ncbi:F-box/kelch-repeat protein [Raphanus sativus]|nr:F-box/kelch-repeat protein At3g61590 isoform X2 [Raphanus sativus]XP_056846301.1 F-box/kelch-repeat protein At3g61590 isoform X2 [Raphanus sativus]XP_056846302.1 F-box/kelch-repeat protein At3g61590 isoform X2 [Raphanus sativus]XP_056846303.1 F-box/kelch-repeat protein At3g61590 isoform X2 [Raphanus sativus]XP_056846304.1 F-box/kelch-repeat protein At3g61590 isoform X2 [Raphanus sativus]KAJ4884899.1 F-box/kelch-repeat protein [Raphanus sativus]
MEAETSWTTYPYNYITTHVPEAESYSDEQSQDETKVQTFPMDSLLPNDLLERILTFLPIASIFRAGTVCKRWNEIVSSQRFLSNFSNNNSSVPQSPWYFMFTSTDDPSGYAYDPVIRKWYSFDLPCIETSNWFVASSCGLVCFMDNDCRNKIYVSNPITKHWRKLTEPPGHRSTDYTALSTSVNRAKQSYSVSIVKSKQVPGDFFQWDLSVHLYSSETMTWTTRVTDVLTGWRGGDESVICDNVLYFLIYSTGGSDHRHGLVALELSSTSSSSGVLMRSFIPMPCSLTCGRLMNLKEKLVVVGGIGKHDRPDIIKGIGVWVLKGGGGKEWQEVARMPQRFFQGFGELDDVFASSGSDDMVYVQSYGSPALLTFDMNLKCWKWSQKCPVSKKFPLQLFTGFCFEPRLEIAP